MSKDAKALYNAAAAGDVNTVRNLLKKNASLLNCKSGSTVSKYIIFIRIFSVLCYNTVITNALD